jgi:ribosomal protein L44E
MSTTQPSTPRLSRLAWIKRRARRIEQAYGSPRRLAIGEAIFDRNAFVGTRLQRVIAHCSADDLTDLTGPCSTEQRSAA